MLFRKRHNGPPPRDVIAIFIARLHRIATQRMMKARADDSH